MQTIEITDIKNFTGKLLLGEEFDKFQLIEAQVSTSVDFIINGNINREFFDESSETTPYVLWKDIKPFVLSFIKGKVLPIRFRLIFSLKNADIPKLIQKYELNEDPENISSLNFTILYERDHKDPENFEDPDDIIKANPDQRMICTTGFARKNFTLDKTIENFWDETIEKFINKLQ